MSLQEFANFIRGASEDAGPYAAFCAALAPLRPKRSGSVPSLKLQIPEDVFRKEPLLAYNIQFFAKEGPGGEKTEEPTGKRLREAREKGQVAKSKEIGQAFSLLAFFIILRFWLSGLAYRFEMFFPAVYNQFTEVVKMPNGEVPQTQLLFIFRQMLVNMLIYLAPFFAIGCIVAFLCDIVQVGWKIVSEPFKPKLSKMNPLSGIKKIFSPESIFNLLLSFLKILVISVVVFLYMRSRQESIFLLYDIPLRQGIAAMGDIIIEMGIRISVVYMIVALADWIYQKHKFHEDMKMTKQEVKDEMKNDEGDPQIKSKQRQRMREASMRRMMSALPQADVVITNPDHYAVAVLYDADQYTAPVVLAKGKDHLAQRIKEIAKDNEIEIVENKPLARMLYANVEIGEMVPPELYKPVAEVLAFVYHLKGKV